MLNSVTVPLLHTGVGSLSLYLLRRQAYTVLNFPSSLPGLFSGTAPYIAIGPRLCSAWYHRTNSCACRETELKTELTPQSSTLLT